MNFSQQNKTKNDKNEFLQESSFSGSPFPFETDLSIIGNNPLEKENHELKITLKETEGFFINKKNTFQD